MKDAVPGSGWKARQPGDFHKTFLFADFQTALEFVNRVAAAAERGCERM